MEQSLSRQLSQMLLKHFTKRKDMKGVCVFDLDETLSSPMCKRLHSSFVFEEIVDSNGEKKYRRMYKDKKGNVTYGETQLESPPYSIADEEFCYREATRNAHKLIDACERNHMALAVNTARTQKFFNHPDPHKFSERRIDPSVIARLDREDVPFCHRINRETDASASKVECMTKLKDIFQVENKNVLLIDDNKSNTDAVKTHGFSAISVDTSGLGSSSRTVNNLNSHLSFSTHGKK